MSNGIVNIRGKEYQTVALRVQTFREKFPDYGLRTRIINADENFVTMAAEIWNGDFLVATGHAEEKRGSSNINKTSALENCETSAIGRALASLGLGGTEFASANEVQNAIHQQSDFINRDQLTLIQDLLRETNSNEEDFLKFAKTDSLEHIVDADYQRVLKALEAKRERLNAN